MTWRRRGARLTALAYELSVALGYATAAAGETLAEAQREADAGMYAEKFALR